MRNPGNIGKGNTHKRHFTGPRIAVRGDRHVIPRLDAVLHVIPRLDAVSRNTLSVIPHLMRNPGNTGKGNTHKRHFSGPRIVVRGDRHVIPRYDAVSRNTLPVIPHLMRNLGILAKAIPTRGLSLGPASLCGVTRYSTRYPGIPAKAPQRNSPD